jgi:DNA-binding Lrp family transcriptional regulator
MPSLVTDSVLSLQDQRLITALQYDARLTAERAAEVLGLSPATVRRRWQALGADGAFRVVVSRNVFQRGSIPSSLFALRIRVLPGTTDAVAAALAARDDIPEVHVMACGDEIFALAGTEPGTRDPLVFRQLPATKAITTVDAATVLNSFRGVADWRHQVLTPAERSALTRASTTANRRDVFPCGIEVDPVDHAVIEALTPDARLPAATVAARIGHSESTVRRRIARLTAEGRLVTKVLVDSSRLGLPICGVFMLRLSPDHFVAAGRAVAEHPAVYRAVATSGPFNLYVYALFRDLAAFYTFVSDDLVGLGITNAETALVSHTPKPLGPSLPTTRPLSRRPTSYPA